LLNATSVEVSNREDESHRTFNSMQHTPANWRGGK